MSHELTWYYIMEDENFNKRKAALLAEHAAIMNEGFPAEKTELFQKKIGDLPEHHQKDLRHLIDISNELKKFHETKSR